MIAPHQSGDNGIFWKEFDKSVTTNIGISHKGDLLSGDALTGDNVLNIRTDNGSYNFFGKGTAKAHSIDGFHEEVERVIDVFNDKEAAGANYMEYEKYGYYKKVVDQGDAGNKTYDRKTGKYNE